MSERHNEHLERKVAGARTAIADLPRLVAPPSPAVLTDTLEVWQPKSSRELSREDAREIVTNMLGFFRELAEWKRAERADAADGEKGSADVTSA